MSAPEERRMERESVWPEMVAQSRGVRPVLSWKGGGEGGREGEREGGREGGRGREDTESEFPKTVLN